MEGKLFVISTPIGNIGDISYRAVGVLENIDLLVCEDSRVTGRLLHILADKGMLDKLPKLYAYNDYNAKDKYSEIVDKVSEGLMVGLVSDAGTPTISDPGYRIIRECYDRNLNVEVLPGTNAVIQALVMSGIGGEQFYYHGFLAKKPGKRIKEIEQIAKIFEINENIKIVIFLTPHRVDREIDDLRQVLGKETVVVLLREMTKIHEERIESSLGNMSKDIENKKMKGEMVMVLAKAKSVRT